MISSLQSRLLLDEMRKATNANFVIEYKPGALDLYRRESLEQYRGPSTAMHNQRPNHPRSTT